MEKNWTKRDTIFARGCKAALSATKYGWHEVTRIRWMPFKMDVLSSTGVMPPRTDRRSISLLSVPFLLLHHSPSTTRFFFFFFTFSRFPFLSFPMFFPLLFFSFFSFQPLRNYHRSRDNFGWQKTKRGRLGCNSRDVVNAVLTGSKSRLETTVTRSWFFSIISKEKSVPFFRDFCREFRFELFFLFLLSLRIRFVIK